DEIKAVLAAHLKSQPIRHWLDRLEPADYWCAEVLTWERLRKTEAYRVLDFEQTVCRENAPALTTTRCPIRIDGETYKSPLGAPRVGQHTTEICSEFGL